MKKDLTEKERITKYIFLKSKPQKADLAIVFGTRHQRAAEKAAEIYNKNLVPLILVTGGVNRITKKTEAKEISGKMIDLGVKKEDILLEEQSTNTLENVLFSKKIIEQKIGFEKLRKILVITKRYHIRRALMTLKKYFPSRLKFFPVTYAIYDFTEDNWFEEEKGREKVLSEWEKIKKYLKKDHIEEL